VINLGLSKKEYFVKDLIIDDEYGVIDSKATIQEAARKMKEIGVPDLVVIEGEKVLGVIADFDIIQKIVAEGKDPKSANVITTMYKIESVTLDSPVTEAFTRMRDLQVNVVPVVENGKLVGVSTIQDCWSYIPDEDVDEVGLISVSNTRTVEFWFATICTILAFVFGIVLPFGGIYGYFSGNPTDLLSFFGVADIQGDIVTFHLFEARGFNLLVPFLELIESNGAIWISVVVCSVLLFVFGVLGLFSLIYASFSDAKDIFISQIIKTVISYLSRLYLPWNRQMRCQGKSVPWWWRRF